MPITGQLVTLNRNVAKTPNELTGITATTTSANIKGDNHSGIIIYFEITAGTGAWTIKVQSKCPTTGTYVDHYDHNGNLMSTGSLSASRSMSFVGIIPSDFKLVCTEDTNGATVNIGHELVTL